METRSLKRAKLILAIDPFEETLKPSRKAIRELHHWARRMTSRIEAVHVLEGDEDDPAFNRAYTRAHDLLSARIRQLNLGLPVGIRILHQTVDSEISGPDRDPARVLADYAREAGADVILVSSHGRKWLSRMVLGSFSEKLLMNSGVPVLFFGLLPAPDESLQRVLFATDFSESSKAAFRLFLSQMAPMNPEVVILHVAEYPNLLTGMSLTGAGAYLPETYWKVMKESLVSEGNQWVEAARERGIQARVVIEDGLGDIASAIVRTAREERASMIGLSTMRRELQRLVMGSISTRVFRSRGHSVWVCGPRVFERAQAGSVRHPPVIGREMR